MADILEYVKEAGQICFFEVWMVEFRVMLDGEYVLTKHWQNI